MQDSTKFIQLFEQYAYSKNYSDAFSELLDYFLIGFKYYDTPEEKQAALLLLTTHTKKELIVAILTEIGELSEGFSDPLGNVFERLISKGQKGQFFTPEPIATLMATIAATDDVQDGQSVYDPACGSGRMLLAAAKINRHLRFMGRILTRCVAKLVW